ncbi:MAG: 50S ribosomal protein L19 [candidate division Zixibacteria bacterium]|nr:50S ribosomal protein L19 [candidate division Zixibacteria bacterium]
MDLISVVEGKHLKKKVPNFSSGDTVKVHVRIKEGDKERIQVFEGVVLQKRGKGISQTFTVRKISSGIGVERIFPLHSPFVSNIEVTKKGKVRRAKLFYLRKMKGKAAKIEEGERMEREIVEEVKPESKNKE